MNDLIAKKYAKSIPHDQVDDFYENLCVLNLAFKCDKFKHLINANQLSKDKKFDLISSFYTKLDKKFENFIRLLLENSRLNLVQHITDELYKQKMFKEKAFLGFVYSKQKLTKTQSQALAKALEKKFQVKLKLENKTSQDESIKVELEELGYELSFSMKDLEAKMSDFVLKII